MIRELKQYIKRLYVHDMVEYWQLRQQNDILHQKLC